MKYQYSKPIPLHGVEIYLHSLLNLALDRVRSQIHTSASLRQWKEPLELNEQETGWAQRGNLGNLE